MSVSASWQLRSDFARRVQFGIGLPEACETLSGRVACYNELCRAHNRFFPEVQGFSPLVSSNFKRAAHEEARGGAARAARKSTRARAREAYGGCTFR